MKRNLLSLLMITVCAGIVSTFTSCKYDDSAVKADITALQDLSTQMSALQAAQATAIAELDKAYKAADTEVQKASIAAAKALVEESTAALNGRIDALNDAIGTNAAAIAGLNIEINDLKNLCNEQKAALAIAAADASKALALAQTNEGAIATLKTQLADINTKLANLATKAELSDALQKAAAAQADATAALQAIDELKTEVANQGLDINNLKTQIADLKTKMTQDIAAAVTSANSYTDQKINELRQELTGTVTSVKTLQDIVNASLNALITSLRYETQDTPVLKYNVFAGTDFVFGKLSATETLEGAISVKNGDQFITKKGGFLYLTINPAEVDFTNTQLALVNSTNQKHPVVTLEGIQKADVVLTRAQVVNNGNGMYKAQATTQGQYSKTIEINPTHAGNDVLFALQNTYKSGTNSETKTVTGNYDIVFSTEKAAPITNFEWIGCYDEACTQIAPANPVLGTQFEFGFEPGITEYVGYVKAMIAAADVYAFYITYDKNFFVEGDVYKKVYDGSQIADAFKFTCKSENLNKATAITYTILNYDGTVTTKTYKVSYTAQLLKNIVINATVVPGAKEDTWNMTSGFATLELQDSVKNAFNAAEYVVYQNNAQIWNTSCIPGIYPNYTCNINKIDFEYDPTTIKLPTGVENTITIGVTDNSNHRVTTITVNVTVDQPDHLDAYITKNNRIPAAFGFKGELFPEFDKDMIAAWAQPATAPNLSYALDGAFNRLSSYVPDAIKAGKGGWTRSNNSVFKFNCADATANVVNYPDYVITATKENITVKGEVKEPSKYKNKTYNLTENVDYYNCGRYLNAAKDEFKMIFMSPINVGIFAKKNQYETPIYFDHVPALGVKKTLDFTFVDFSKSPAGSFNLSDSRISKVVVVLDEENPNFGLMKNFAWDEATRTISFDYTSTSLNDGAVVSAILEVTDIWDVTSLVHISFKLAKSPAVKPVF